MCGILARFDPRGLDFEPELVRQQCRTMHHRGPDDEGYHFEPGVALAMRRLSIVDVACGHQPISDESGRIWVVLNGEIYNHRSLRRRLEGRGHRFATRSDTEVIVHLYEEVGEACVGELDGMFGFALWDGREKKLLVARDRLGIKPVYYHVGEPGGRVSVASEIKAIIEDPSIPRAVNRDGLHHYLAHLYVPAPETMFQGIYKLPPGHFMVCDERGIRSQRYWDVDFQPDPSMTLEHAVEALRMALTRSVEARLMAEVPLGAFLSGGIDSSVIVALMAQLMDEPVKTFTLGFGDEHARFNELEHARDVAQLFATEHHEFVVRESHVAELLTRAVWYFDEPFGDGLHTYFVAQMARPHVTVALTGLGSDELFCGYGRQARLKLAHLYRDAPALMRRSLSALLERVPRTLRERTSYARARRTIERASLSEVAYYAREIQMMADETRERVYTPDMRRAHMHHDGHAFLARTLADKDIASPWDRISYMELKTTMVEDFLHYADRMGMAHSLELRVPFLDHRVVELAATMPFRHKVRGVRENKFVLKKLAETILPERIVYRAKQPFFLPLDDWLENDLAAYVRQVLAPDKLADQGYLDHAGVTRILDEHARGHARHGWAIWALLVFQVWHDRFIEPDGVAP